MEARIFTAIVALAKLYEEKYIPVRMYWTRRNQANHDISNIVNATKTLAAPIKATPTLPTLVSPAAHQTLPSTMGYNNQYMRISFNEIQLIKAKGLCFNFDENFTPCHKCANKRLLLLQWDEEPPDNSNTEDSEFVVELDSSPQNENEQSPKLSLNAMNSALVSGTMRFLGLINRQPVKILLDGGSDDSFIQPRIIKFLQLDIQPTDPFKVLVGNGKSLQVEGIIDELQVKNQGFTLKFPVYLLPIVGAEVILGAAWLATLGPHMMDYWTLSIQFYHDNQFITLKGEKQCGPQQASVHQLNRLCTTHSIT